MGQDHSSQRGNKLSHYYWFPKSLDILHTKNKITTSQHTPISTMVNPLSFITMCRLLTNPRMESLSVLHTVTTTTTTLSVVFISMQFVSWRYRCPTTNQHYNRTVVERIKLRQSQLTSCNRTLLIRHLTLLVSDADPEHRAHRYRCHSTLSQSAQNKRPVTLNSLWPTTPRATDTLIKGCTILHILNFKYTTLVNNTQYELKNGRLSDRNQIVADSSGLDRNRP